MLQEACQLKTLRTPHSGGMDQVGFWRSSQCGHLGSYPKLTSEILNQLQNECKESRTITMSLVGTMVQVLWKHFCLQ